MTFDKAIPSADNPTITEGAATFSNKTILNNDVILNFTGVTDQQYVTFNLGNVASTDGGTGGSGSVRVGFLVGDVNQTRKVSLGDLFQVNLQLADAADATNFLKDVNASGGVTLANKFLVNLKLTDAMSAP